MKQIKKPYYSLEFKQDAVGLVLSKGYSISEAAISLGVSQSALRKWVSSERGPDKNRSQSGDKLTLSEPQFGVLKYLKKCLK